MEADMSTDRGDTKEEWFEFTQDVTMHGVRYVYLKKIALVRRVLWMLLILTALCIFVLSAHGFLASYSQKRVETSVQYRTASNIQFPTITICNRNMWSLSRLLELEEEMGSSVMFEAFYLMSDEDEIREFKLQESWNESLPLYAPVYSLNHSATEELFESAGMEIHNTFRECFLYDAEVPCEMMVNRVKVADGGFCFQINSNGSMESSVPGQGGGIRFDLSIEADNYSPGPRSLAEGFSLMFHEPHEVPLMDLSVGIYPGTEANIVLNKAELYREPPPAYNSTCFDSRNLPNPLHYYEQYSYSACITECQTAYIINKCGCRHVFQPALNETDICLIPEVVKCSAWYLWKFKWDEEGLQSCECPDPCVQFEYTPTVSYYRFPSESYLALLFNGNEELAEIWRRLLTKHAVRVYIYFGKMSYQVLEERQAYTFLTMLANVGGTLGFCIGGSLLTLCEFVEFAILMIIKVIKDRKSVKQASNSVVKVSPIQNEEGGALNFGKERLKY